MITKMSHDWEAAVVTIRYDNATLTGADEAKAFAFLRAAVDTQHAKAGGSFELRVQWILEPKPRTLRDEARAVVPEQWQADAVLDVVKAHLDALNLVDACQKHIDALFGNDRTPNGGTS